MKVILSHSGKQHSYQVAKALRDLGFLEKFYTSSYIKNKKLQEYLLENKNTYWTRRFIDGLDGNFINSSWKYEVKEVILRKLFGKNEFSHKAVLSRDISFDKKIALQIKKHKANVFWGFQGSCLESVRSANSIGIDTFCEQTAPYYQEVKNILQEERKLSPEWIDSMEDINFPLNYEKRLIEEPLNANKVVVASEFSKATLLNSGISERKLLKLHLGCEIGSIVFKDKPTDFGKRPLKLLYVGRIAQSKGIKYLMEAITKFNKTDVALDLIGHLIGGGSALNEYKGYYKHLHALPQEVLYKTYCNYDALVLPTLYDGFGLVIIEAMAAGLPVITTKNSFGPEVIEDGKNGWVVPIRNSSAIEESFSKLLNLSQENFQKMRLNARYTAEKFTWQAYQKNLSMILT